MIKLIRIGEQSFIVNMEHFVGLKVTDLSSYTRTKVTKDFILKIQAFLSDSNKNLPLNFSNDNKIPVITIQLHTSVHAIYYDDLFPLLKQIENDKRKLVQLEDIVSYLFEFLLSNNGSINLNEADEVHKFYDWLSDRLTLRAAKVTKLLLIDNANPSGVLDLPYDYQGWYLASIQYGGRLSRHQFNK